jgi:hypothetical protein
MKNWVRVRFLAPRCDVRQAARVFSDSRSSMARPGRTFLPDQPLRVIARGNNRGAVLFGEDDHAQYGGWLAEAAVGHGCRILKAVRARMVRHPRDDRWSSLRAHADGRTDPLVSDHPVYPVLGRGAEARQSAYRALFRGALESGFVNALRAATNGGWACAAMIDNYRCNKRALR